MAFEHNSNLDQNEPAWSEVDKTKLPFRAYAVEVGEADKKSTWKLPHHWVKDASGNDDLGVYTDGQLLLHARGLAAAFAAIQSTRTGNPMGVDPSVIDHINGHREDIAKSEDAGDYYLRIEKDILKDYGFSDDDIESIQKNIEKEVDENPYKIEDVLTFSKVDELNKIVYGIVYEADFIDADGNFVKAEEVQRMAWRYMSNLVKGFVGIDEQHKGINGIADVVESHIAQSDLRHDGKLIWKKGSWIMAVRVLEPEVWNKILSGAYTGFSLAGKAEEGETVKGKKGTYLGTQSTDIKNREL